MIPERKPTNSVSTSLLERAYHWCNTLSRKILGYKSAYDAFLKEVEKAIGSGVQFHIAI